ncbi:MAG: glycosyltransferase family 4 protein, partial [Rhodobacteraceae bacterium]|nr:glycosyltransferase family 4 protein [Paracoccaceae bacterium]
IEELWRRAPLGTNSYSICGITHTTATAAVMQGFFDLRMAPQMEWDAVICTSNAVRQSVAWQQEMIDDHMRWRFGKAPPRFQMPVIPLGIHCDDFRPDPAARASLRARMGVGEGDVVCTLTARLNPNIKFDPLPFYLALQAAQVQLGAGCRLHLALCGVFSEDHGRRVFLDSARKLMPDVGFLHLDGTNAQERKAAMSAGDIYLFPIDNVQETFGLAPIEGMAAGLPLVVSDWDGMKDTVTADAGFRIPTHTLEARHAVTEAERYRHKIDSYAHYLSKVSAMTRIDLPEMTARLVELARNPDLRRKMGAAGQARARSLYDWSAIIPQMQDLWADLAARRRAGQAGNLTYKAHALPTAPSPFALFRSYPTGQLRFGGEAYVATDLTGRAGVADLWALRDYTTLKRTLQTEAEVTALHRALVAAGQGGASAAALAAASKLPLATVERALMWLLKFDFARPAARG